MLLFVLSSLIRSVEEFHIRQRIARTSPSISPGPGYYSTNALTYAISPTRKAARSLSPGRSGYSFGRSQREACGEDPFKKKR